jgi:hypothetical protein
MNLNQTAGATIANKMNGFRMMGFKLLLLLQCSLVSSVVLISHQLLKSIIQEGTLVAATIALHEEMFWFGQG